MNIHDRAGLKQAACNSLAAANGRDQKLVLIYAGVSAVFSLLISVVDYLLGSGISDTGGLSGMGLRSILSTAQTVLPAMQLLLIPFWELGFFHVTLKLARKEQPEPEDLFWGFRNLGLSARYLLLRTGLYVAAAFAGSYVGTQVFLFTPWATPLMDMILNGAADEAAMAQTMAQVQLPLLLFNAAFFLLFLIPMLLRYRLAGLILIDHPENGALVALRGSRRMTRGNCKALLRLDLSLWWFYAVDLLLLAVAYSDQLLPLLGVELPVSADVAFFVSYIISLALQVGWYSFALARVQVTYVHAYEALKNPEPQQAVPVGQPWKYDV